MNISLMPVFVSGVSLNKSITHFGSEHKCSFLLLKLNDCVLVCVNRDSGQNKSNFLNNDKLQHYL